MTPLAIGIKILSLTWRVANSSINVMHREAMNTKCADVDENKNNGLDYEDPASGTKIHIGADAKNGWDGEVAEVIYLDRVLTAEEITTIETYLMEKYGITP